MYGKIYSLSPAGHETMTLHEYSNLLYYIHKLSFAEQWELEQMLNFVYTYLVVGF